MAYRFDLHNRIVVHDNGFTVSIADLFDKDGEYTEDVKEVVVIGTIMPPDGIYVTLDLRDLAADDMVTVLQ